MKADPKCPSCNGTAWAVIRTANITVASGPCKCVGGMTWATDTHTNLIAAAERAASKRGIIPEGWPETIAGDLAKITD